MYSEVSCASISTGKEMNNNKNKSILIVESNVRVFESLQTKLKDGGMIVISSKDGFEGYERAKKEMPDIILVEVSVPVMNGLKLCKLLKFDERYRKLNLILMGSKNILSNVEQDEYQYDGKIEKPFRYGDLRAIIDQVLQGNDNV